MTHTLSPVAMQVIDDYLNLHIGHVTLPCPYYNNKRAGMRGGLRVLLGKGTPDDIAQEAKLIGLKQKIDIDTLTTDEMRHFLVDHNLGVDCSGLTFHVLDAELQSTHQASLGKTLVFVNATNPLRKLLAKLRPAENTNVAVLANQKNTTDISLTDVRPGDLIIMQDTGRSASRDHILLVHEVESHDGTVSRIHYTHSLAWSSDGQYDHGVRQGVITVTNATKGLVDQVWREREKENDENETYQHAKDAKALSLRRLNIFT